MRMLAPRVYLATLTSENSAQQLKPAITSLVEVWPSAILDAISSSDISRRPGSIAIFPRKPHDPANFLAIVWRGIADLPTNARRSD